MAQSQRKPRLGLAESFRRRLLHILPDNRLRSATLFPMDLVACLAADYQQTVIMPGGGSGADNTLVRGFLLSGAAVLHVERYGQIGRLPDLRQFCGAVVYDIPRLPELPVPSVYYQYADRPQPRPYSLRIAPDAWGERRGLPDLCVAPGVATRRMRDLHAVKHKTAAFSVAVLSSCADNRFPAELAAELAGRAPASWMLYLTDHPCWRPRITRPVGLVPLTVDGGLSGCSAADAVVYAHAADFKPGYGRLCLECMASGVPVLAERRGSPAARYRDGNEILTFENVDELLEKLEWLRTNPEEARRIGANAQTRAGWDDITICAGAFKRALRTIGA